MIMRNRHRSANAWVLTCLVMLGSISAKAQKIEPSNDPGLHRLLHEIERLAEGGDGRVGVAAIHLETGRRLFLNGQERFPMASTYKVPIAVQLLSRVDRGEISLHDMIELSPEDLHPGSGTLTRLFDDPGVILSVHNLLELMLLISDNSATDLTLHTAGGSEAVNARMAELGVHGLRVDRPTSLLIADFLGMQNVPEDGKIGFDHFQKLAGEIDDINRLHAAAAFTADPKDTSTPAAMAMLLETIWKGKALSDQNTEFLLDILQRVETGKERLKGLLPPNTNVAHKTGTIGGTTNDVGYIYLPENAGHVVTVVFIKNSKRENPERERIIAHIARALYDYFAFNPGS